MSVEAMKLSIYAMLLIASVFFLSGCPGGDRAERRGIGLGEKGGGQSSSANRAAKKKSRYPIDSLAPTTVVIRVNGQPITQAEYRRWYVLRDKIYRVTQKIPFSERSDKTASFAQESRRLVPSDLIQRALMRQEGEKLGVSVPEKRLRRLEKEFMKAIQRPKDPFSSIDSLFGERYANDIRATIAEDAFDELTLEKSSTNNLVSVTEADIDAHIKFVKEWNAQADAKMKIQRERALKAKHDILNGGYFYVITTNRADLAKEDGDEWQTVELGEFQADEPIAKWLATAKPGDISDPIDLEDGLAIIGLKYAYMSEPPAGIAPAMQYELVRCTFYAYDKLEETDDRKVLAAEILKERRKLALQELGKRLTATAKIEFPAGENIFAVRPKRPNMPKKTKKKKVKKVSIDAVVTNSQQKCKHDVENAQSLRSGKLEK